MRVGTKPLNQEEAVGLISLIEPGGIILIEPESGNRMLRALLEENAAGHELAKTPDRLTHEGEEIPTISCSLLAIGRFPLR